MQAALRAMGAGKEFTIKVQPKLPGCSGQSRPVLSMLFRPSDSEQLQAAGMPHIGIPAWGAGFGDSSSAFGSSSGGGVVSPFGTAAQPDGIAAAAAAAAVEVACRKQPAYYFGIVQQEQWPQSKRNALSAAWTNGLLTSTSSGGQASQHGSEQVRP